MSEPKKYGVDDASYQAAGGYEGIQRLVEAFYGYMDSLPEAHLIRTMHAESLDVSIDKLVCFLSGWLGGPKLYRERYGKIIIPQAHRHLSIGCSERDAWLLCMEKAIADQPYADDFKIYLLKQLGVPAEFCRNKE